MDRKKSLKKRREPWLEISDCLDRPTGMSARRFGRRGLWLLRSGLAYQPGEVSL